MATLRRYTNALALIDLLQNARISLLSPSRWVDQNDALGLEAYGRIRGDGSVYAACFASGPEQSHHWQLFASGDHGVCIIFRFEALTAHLDSLSASLLHGPVLYHNLEEVRAMQPIAADTLPFLKRATFKAENEYRVVAWQGSLFASPTYPIPIHPQIVERVVFGPAMPDSYGETLRDLVRTKPSWRDVECTRSRLFNNASWARTIEEGIGRSL